MAQKVTFSRDMLINELVLDMEGTIAKKDVIKLFESLESNIYKHLSSATPSNSVVLKVFKGIYLMAENRPDTYFKNGTLFFEEHICYKAKFSTYFKNKLNGKIN